MRLKVRNGDSMQTLKTDASHDDAMKGVEFLQTFEDETCITFH